MTFIQRYRGVAKARVGSSNTSEIPLSSFLQVFSLFSLLLWGTSFVCFSCSWYQKYGSWQVPGLTSCLSQVLIFDKSTLIGPTRVSCPGTHYWQVRFLEGAADTYGLDSSQRVARKEERLGKKVKTVHSNGTVLGLKEIVVQKGKQTTSSVSSSLTSTVARAGTEMSVPDSAQEGRIWQVKQKASRQRELSRKANGLLVLLLVVMNFFLE